MRIRQDRKIGRRDRKGNASRETRNAGARVRVTAVRDARLDAFAEEVTATPPARDLLRRRRPARAPARPGVGEVLPRGGRSAIPRARARRRSAGARRPTPADDERRSPRARPEAGEARPGRRRTGPASGSRRRFTRFATGAASADASRARRRGARRRRRGRARLARGRRGARARKKSIRRSDRSRRRRGGPRGMNRARLESHARAEMPTRWLRGRRDGGRVSYVRAPSRGALAPRARGSGSRAFASCRFFARIQTNTVKNSGGARAR